MTLPNADRGLRFLFEPDWSVFTEPTVYIAALGQAFFSIGLGMAIFTTFGSYIPASFSLPSSAAITAFGDSFFAIIAGIAIFPAVFSFGVDPKAGPELAFITLPQTNRYNSHRHLGLRARTSGGDELRTLIGQSD